MIKLDVPLISQPLDSYECGSACAQMLLYYYGQKSIPIETINERLPIRPEFGLFLYEVGSYFLELGYDVKIDGLNTRFMGTQHIGANAQDIKQHIQSLRHEEYYTKQWKNHQVGLDTIVKFVDDGGQMTGKILTADDIKTELGAGHPVMPAITTSFLNNKFFRHNEHFAVIKGYDDNGFWINDPGVKNSGGEEQQFPFHYITHAIAANAACSVEGGMMMTVKPR